MHSYQREFIQLAIENNVLTFGEFILKSGRKSPYFFNSGLFFQAQAVQKLGEFYAEAILQHSLDYDLLFGPAYKGIPLVTTTGIALARKGKNYPLSFNRKEVKDHGEGGTLVGAPLKNQRVLIVDDVITAGTAFYESKTLIESAGGSVAGIVIALDRQEKGREGQQSALQEIQEKENIPVISIITLEHLISYLKEQQDFILPEVLENMMTYKKHYGA
jgi:orotate phosphoribosyltransferase